MMTLAQTLELATRLHHAGSLRQAEEIYQQILRLDPQHSEALHLLGVLAHQVGRNDLAAEYIGKALSIAPNYPEAHNSMGVVLKASGKPEEAIPYYQEALRQRPNYAEAHNNLGNALRALRRFPEAMTSLLEAIRLRPDYADAHQNLGRTLEDSGQLELAAASYREAVRFNADHALAHERLGWLLSRQQRLDEAEAHTRRAAALQPDSPTAHTQLADVLWHQGRFEEARLSAEQVLRLRPDHSDSHNNLGSLLEDLDRLQEAETCYRQALKLRPDDARIHGNLSNTLRRQGRLDEAMAAVQEALRLRPDLAAAQINLGNILMDLGRLEEAADTFRQALQRLPDHATGHANLSLVLFLLGDFERAWPEYEWRWRCKGKSLAAFDRPLWDGSALDGRTILLHTEQGLGDTLQFVRYAPMVKARGGTVLLHVPAALTRLLSGAAGVDQLVPKDDPLPPHDVHFPLMSLPRLLGWPPAVEPAAVPYLAAEPERVEHWRRELSAVPGFRIGIVWQGAAGYRADRDRSIPLRQFAPLGRLPGVRLISLQKGGGREQIAEVANEFAVLDLGPRLDETTGAFVDTAAVLRNLDLVVTADTSVGHLAGALGVPWWLALPFVPDWRWTMRGETSPWYPTVRLFRQTERGDWPGVFARMAAEVGKLLPAPRARSIAVAVAPGELLDRITILEIKSERIRDEAKLRHVRHELTVLRAAREEALTSAAPLQELTAALKAVNEALWEVEDEIRLCEARGDFGPRFVELARSVYRQNDRRAALKRQINDLLGSELVEEKAYTANG